jgi:N-acetylglutamate synthase-like GNAT family acetyltransferase
MIELATVKDIDTIIRINLQIPVNLSDSFWLNRKWISEEIKLKNYYLLVEKGIAIGAICLKIFKDYAVIQTLAIDEKCQRQGYGSELVKFAFEKAIHTAKKIYVMSFIQANCHVFYLKHGFYRYKEQDNYNGLPFWYMVKKL